MAEIEDVDIYYAVDRRDDILTTFICVCLACTIAILVK